MMKLEKNNKYDYAIVLFIALLAFGGIGGFLQPVRAFILICIPFMLRYFLLQKTVLRRYRFEQYFFIFWWLYVVVSLLWAVIPEESMKAVFYMTVNFMGFFVFLWLAANANRPQETLAKGWIIFFLLTAPIALYELLFDWHLPLSKWEEGGMMMHFDSEVMERRYALVTYDNLNRYNVMMCYVFPFLSFTLLGGSKNKWNTILNWGVLLLLVYFVVSNNSRGAILCFVFGLFLFFCFYLKKGNGKSLFVLLAVIIVASFYAIAHFDELFSMIIGRFEAQGLEDEGRMENIVCGIDAFLKSHFLGVGVANYSPVMETQYGLTVTAPHNVFLEVGVQYGLLVFVGFMWLLWRILKRGMDNPLPANRTTVLIALCMFPLVHVVDSNYLLGVPIWVFIASLLVLSDKEYNDKVMNTKNMEWETPQD